MYNSQIKDYWSEYLESLPEDQRVSNFIYCAEQWGDSNELAQELGELIASGIKTATCSSLWEYEFEGGQIPETGIKTIVLDGKNEPLCIVETVSVEIIPFDQVSAEFAYQEGEGDRSLDYWRNAHWNFFTRVLKKIKKEPSMDMPLVCEKFKVVYK